MSDTGSEDDVPLARTNGSLSSPKVSRTTDRDLDRSVGKKMTAKDRNQAGLSIRNGTVKGDPMDLDQPTPNGASKRKSRLSITNNVNYKDESDSDGQPLAKRPRKSKATSDSDDLPIGRKRNGKLPPSYTETSMLDDDSDDDQPLGAKLAQKKRSIENKANKEAKAIRAAESKGKRAIKKEEDSDDDVPLTKSRPAKRQSNGNSKKANGVKKEESDSDVPISQKVAAAKKKAAPKGKAPSIKKEKSEEPGDDEDEADDENAWWNQGPNDDDSVKWTTLEHNGVLFPPAYEPLPKNVKLFYDGGEVDLHPEAEEVAGFYGAMLKSEHCEKPVFNKNFMEDFREVLKATGGAKDAKTGKKIDIKHFEKLNFDNIYNYYSAKSEARKARSSSEKKTEKAEKDEFEAPYMYCKWDGRKEKVGNFRVEPPGLFRGRGDHPKTGKLKKRVMPEQVTINIGKGVPEPPPPEGHKWKAVQHDDKCTWLATWKENINNNTKYVMLSANSTIKGQSDWKKFEKSRELKKYIDKIRADYKRELKSELMADRQRATAVYFIDKFALRAGNEKDAENEAETVGCCSLKYEHITLKEPNTVVFDFLGKDSIRFNAEFMVEPQVFKNLKLFKKSPKTDGDDLFDRLTTTQLNRHLSSYMKGLTAKVFRTYNASYTMATLLRDLKIPKNATILEKVKLYNDCNREVAVLCNHKRSVGAQHEAAMAKLGDRLKGLEYQKWRLKQMILNLDPKQKKKKGAIYFALPEELMESWIKDHQKFLVEEMRTKITKKFQKDNEKRQADKERPLPEKELKERLKTADELAAKFKKENKSKKVEAEGKGPTVEKLLQQISKKEDQIRALEIQASDRDGNKEVALGTSKINYIDPRLTVVFSKKVNVPIEKLFSKSLRDKFMWAIKSVEAEDDWQF
ncbi:eukaryotic DNA topoisomerase I [Zalerion maritima]|uniref:DNA topoisomerase I n=1 Tax=Zalerion maritima TaxID=339359 RepID=A0AAD5WXH4_9PEZI|nr:eukaryotic DNA topoisomerase I [Zalerion maritima]